MPTIVIECSDLAGARRMGATLVNHGHRLDTRRLHRGDTVPADLVDVDAVLCFGGPQSANDDALPWMEPLLDFIRNTHAAGIPMFGVCLGAQLFARALGGTVAAMEQGPRLGWAGIDLSPEGREDPLHKGLPWNWMQFHWNRDAVQDLPPGARVLSRGDRGDVQGWRLGVRTYGVQYHPEIDAGQIEAWKTDDADLIREAGLDAAVIEVDTERHFAQFERLTDRYFDTIAMLLMPLDRRQQHAAHMP